MLDSLRCSGYSYISISSHGNFFHVDVKKYTVSFAVRLSSHVGFFKCMSISQVILDKRIFINCNNISNCQLYILYFAIHFRYQFLVAFLTSDQEMVYMLAQQLISQIFLILKQCLTQNTSEKIQGHFSNLPRCQLSL